MKVVLIIIGNEILSGETLDSNAQHIAQKLAETGIIVEKKITIPDKKNHILNALEDAFNISKLVIVSGGLGPTNDDITKETLAQYFNTPLKFDNKIFEQISTRLSKNKIPINKANKSQAYVPLGATPLTNHYGTAPGLLFENEKGTLFSLPGVPFEMKALMEQEVIPYCRKKFKTSFLINKNILTAGLAEAIMSERIEDIEKGLPANISMAYLPKLGQVKIRLTGYGQDETRVGEEIQKVVLKIEKRLRKYIYGYDAETLEEVIGKMLNERGASLATAESCTGGYLAHLITSVPGSSVYYKGSVIAYSNEIKTGVLGVKESTLIKYGAVSQQTVEQMLHGILETFKAKYGIATTGIAGPSGGTVDKPVGTVWIAAGSEDKILCSKYEINLGRAQNIQRSSVFGLNLLRRILMKG